MRVHSLFKVLPALICPCYLMLIPLILSAQQAEFPFESISLQDLSAFQTTAANWRVRAGASTEGQKAGNLRTQDGTGVLVNLPDDKNKGNLFTKLEHGDIDLDLEFLMAEHSNSGIYLQGRYELQLLDSWGKKHPGFGDCGGIYERWNDAMPAGRQGYEGAAPRLNAARAPGLWQHLYISFQAPRFDAAGKKVENARFLKVELNGTLIHENVELTGPTRGPASDNEAPLGPIMIQGDHGAVAFRNIRYRNFTDKPLQWKTLDYQVAHGPYGVMPEKSKTAIVEKGNIPLLDWQVSKSPNEFAIWYKGTIEIPKDGKYRFQLISNGNGYLKVGNQPEIGPAWGQKTVTYDLKAGLLPVEVGYAKVDGWLQPRLGLMVEGAGFRPTALHTTASNALTNPSAPIFAAVGNEPRLLRSFMDFRKPPMSKSRRIVHAISVGHTSGLHFTMDLDNGTLVQAWKGPFLDVTPMWNDRGDGSSKPLGALLPLCGGSDWRMAGDTSAVLSEKAAYRFRGYELNDAQMPIFKYDLAGLQIEDYLAPDPEGKTLQRSIAWKGNAPGDITLRLAASGQIENLSDNRYAIDDQRFIIETGKGIKAEIRTLPNGAQELLVPLKGSQISYSIIW